MKTVIGMGIAAALISIAGPASADEATREGPGSYSSPRDSDAMSGARDDAASADAMRDDAARDAAPMTAAAPAADSTTAGSPEELGAGGSEPKGLSPQARAQELNHEAWLHEIWYGP